MATITLRRTGRIIRDHGASGEISDMTVEETAAAGPFSRAFKAMERRDNRVRLPAGNYTVTMELSPNRMRHGERRRQFRVGGHNVHNSSGELAAILIHASDGPGGLQGCIAPGIAETGSGVTESDQALESIFTIFGGFSIGTAGTLIVT